MDIDLNNVPIRTISYKENIKIPKEFYEKMDILDIKDVTLEFKIEVNANQDEVLYLKSNGLFVLSDARDLKPVEYPFNIEFTEKLNSESEICGRFLENSQNTLDIMAILWENIVLEKPISYTVCDSLKNNEENTGWRVVGEEDKDQSIDPRLAPLMELLNKKKE